MRGRMIKNLVQQKQEAGRYTVEWQGDDNLGLNVGAGLYIYRLISGNKVINHKMILMK